MRTRRGGLARGDASWSARARRPRRRLNTRDFSGEDAHLVWGPPTLRGTPRRAARAPGKREEIERVSLKTPWRLCRDRSRGKSRRGRRARGRFPARRERGKSRLSHAPDDGRQRSHFVREHLNDGGRRERVCAMCARRDESDIPRASDVTRRISVSRTPRRVRARRRSVVPARDAVQTYSALLFQNLHASERERSPPLEIQSADRWKLSIAASRAAVKDARPVKSFLVGRVETGYG